MKKTVWILNHYASNMYLVGGGRHFSLAKYLKQNGYNPLVFCSNYDHFTQKYCVDGGDLYIEKQEPVTDIPYIFIKTRPYAGNGFDRILNMLDFYRGMLKTAKRFAKKNGAPDVIYASSVHPLTLVAGIKLAKHFGVKCISEVRDLWPESIVAYSSRWTRDNPVMRILYAGEKWIYKKSDVVVMTWAGGYDYIRDRGWQKDIPETKVVHISNGVDLEPYVSNIHEHPYEDADLTDETHKCFAYAGSVRKVNNLSVLVQAARVLKEMGDTAARILVYGDGDELETLRRDAAAQNLDNIIFKGRVLKHFVPSILSQAYASILHNSSTALNKYGQSQNKFFEYLAAGHPILMTYSVGHSVIKERGCGVELETQSPESIAQAIHTLCSLTEEEYRNYCQRAAECAKEFDYKELCNLLISVIDQCLV